MVSRVHGLTRRDWPLRHTPDEEGRLAALRAASTAHGPTRSGIEGTWPDKKEGLAAQRAASRVHGPTRRGDWRLRHTA